MSAMNNTTAPSFDNDNVQPQRNLRWSFHNGGQRTPIGRSVGSEILKKLTKQLTEIYEQTSADLDIQVIPLDNQNETSLMYSCAIVTARYKVKGNPGVAFHTLILEGTGDKIAPRYENVGGQQIEILRVASDAADAVLYAKVSETVTRHNPGATIFGCDSCVVPRNFNLDDQSAVHKLALNAGLACTTELETRFDDFQDVNLAFATQDSNLQINLQFANTQKADAVGNPVRGDVVASFTSQQNTQNGNQSVNSGDKTATISQISGFIDIVYAPVNQAVMNNPWAQHQQNQQPQSKQLYVARMVVTDIESNYACTPAAQLLALTTALAAREDHNWLQAFRPTQTVGEVDLRDIGALGIEANFDNNPNGIGSRIDTKSDSFRTEDLGMLVGALFQQGLIISMDIPESGPQSWYQSQLVQAIYGDVKPMQNIINTANQLTNGAFSRYFTAGSPIFVDTGNRVHLGHYYDKHGVKRDIRDIDYLAVANLVGEKDPAAIRDWSDTFTQIQYPLNQRLQARKRIIMSLTGQTAEFTGFAQRVTFSTRFLEALAMGVRDAGLNVRVVTPMNSAMFNNQRGVANYVGSALMGNNPGSSFMTSGYFAGQQPVYPQQGYARWN